MHPLLAGAPPLQLLRRLGGKPHRPAAGPAGIAQQRLAETAPAEDSPVGEREPVATAFDHGIAHPHVQRAGGVVTEGRTTLELGVHYQQIIGGVRWHGSAVCAGLLTRP